MSELPVTVIALVRHGQSVGNAEARFGGHGPTELTERGHSQAAAAGVAIARDFVPDVLLSSDLVRARQTAEHIGKATGLEMVEKKGLRERSVGILDGLRFSEAQTKHPELWDRLVSRDPSFSPPGGELVDDVYKRVSEAITGIVSAYSGKKVVAVSHGLAIFHAMAFIMGLGSPANRLKVFALVDNCSISRFSQRGEHWRILGINDTCHTRQESPLG